MQNIFKYLVFNVIAIILLGVFWLNYSLLQTPNCQETSSGVLNTSTYTQLQYLKEALHTKNAGEEMQQLFPEGYVFLNSLYALSWVDLVTDMQQDSDIYKEARKEANYAVENILSKKGIKVFNSALPLKYGAFYAGWSNYTLGKSLSLDAENIQDSTKYRIFKENCKRISKTLLATDKAYLESYPYAVWPADNILCLASLSLHDRLFEPAYQQTITIWLDRIKMNLDSKTGLIPHAINYEETLSEGARGSSQSLINCLLPEIDSQFGKEQFDMYRQLFLDHRLGLPGIREYPKGTIGKGDVDSGPVIFGIGGSASIVGQRAFAIYGDKETVLGLQNSINGFGLGYTKNGKKKYLFGQLPMADAFIAWSNSYDCKQSITEHAKWYPWKFQLISIAALFVAFFLLRKNS